MTLFRIIQWIMTSELDGHDKYTVIRDYRVSILHASCTPRCWLQQFSTSWCLEGKEAKAAVRDNTLDMAFESAFALDKWSCQWNICSAELYSFLDSRKISHKYRGSHNATGSKWKHVFAVRALLDIKHSPIASCFKSDNSLLLVFQTLHKMCL